MPCIRCMKNRVISRVVIRGIFHDNVLMFIVGVGMCSNISVNSKSQFHHIVVTHRVLVCECSVVWMHNRSSFARLERKNEN